MLVNILASLQHFGHFKKWHCAFPPFVLLSASLLVDCVIIKPTFHRRAYYNYVCLLIRKAFRNDATHLRFASSECKAV
jgi:hypothetical protein